MTKTKYDQPIRVLSREAFLIRKNTLSKDTLDQMDKKYTLRFYEEKACEQCEWKPERHTDVCDTCAAHLGSVKLNKSVYIKDREYVSLPIGDRRTIKSLLSPYEDVTFINKHPDTEVKYPIKFLGDLRDYQIEAKTAMKLKKRGVLKSAPRTGKTVMSTALVCEVGKKTLILAAQRDWLDNFYETFAGSDTQPPMTNIRKSRIGFANKLEQFEKYDVCLATYQTFLSPKGKKLLEQIKHMFAVLIVDECHRASAMEFSRIVASVNCEYKIGLSGTPTRKDQRHVIVDRLMGPILYESKVERLKPTVKLVRTKFKKLGAMQRGPAAWSNAVSSLENNLPRLRLIAKEAVKDFEQERHMILIPLMRTKAIIKLTALINKYAGVKIAYAFHGGVGAAERKSLVEKARKYKVKILVGNTKLVSTGINIPRASALYEVHLSSNMENCDQRVSRILTPFDGKPTPILKYFLDDFDIRRSCLRNEWWGCVWKEFRPTISPVDHETLKRYMSQKSAKGGFHFDGIL